MLPVRKDGSALVRASLAVLKSAGAAGIMVDMWRGITKSEHPTSTNSIAVSALHTMPNDFITVAEDKRIFIMLHLHMR